MEKLKITTVVTKSLDIYIQLFTFNSTLPPFSALMS